MKFFIAPHASGGNYGQELHIKAETEEEQRIAEEYELLIDVKSFEKITELLKDELFDACYEMNLPFNIISVNAKAGVLTAWLLGNWDEGEVIIVHGKERSYLGRVKQGVETAPPELDLVANPQYYFELSSDYAKEVLNEGLENFKAFAKALTTPFAIFEQFLRLNRQVLNEVKKTLMDAERKVEMVSEVVREINKETERELLFYKKLKKEIEELKTKVRQRAREIEAIDRQIEKLKREQERSKKKSIFARILEFPKQLLRKVFRRKKELEEKAVALDREIEALEKERMKLYKELSKDFEELEKKYKRLKEVQREIKRRRRLNNELDFGGPSL